MSRCYDPSPPFDDDDDDDNNDSYDNTDDGDVQVLRTQPPVP